jgi:hypothetical protein
MQELRTLQLTVHPRWSKVAFAVTTEVDNTLLRDFRGDVYLRLHAVDAHVSVRGLHGDSALAAEDCHWLADLHLPITRNFRAVSC